MDAILIHTNVINNENEEIMKWGEGNVEVLKKIWEKNIELRRKEFEEKRLQLMIKDFEEKAKDVKNYWVTKQT